MYSAAPSCLARRRAAHTHSCNWRAVRQRWRAAGSRRPRRSAAEASRAAGEASGTESESPPPPPLPPQSAPASAYASACGTPAASGGRWRRGAQRRAHVLRAHLLLRVDVIRGPERTPRTVRCAHAADRCAERRESESHQRLARHFVRRAASRRALQVAHEATRIALRAIRCHEVVHCVALTAAAAVAASSSRWAPFVSSAAAIRVDVLRSWCDLQVVHVVWVRRFIELHRRAVLRNTVSVSVCIRLRRDRSWHRLLRGSRGRRAFSIASVEHCYYTMKPPIVINIMRILRVYSTAELSNL